MSAKSRSLWDAKIVRNALLDSLGLTHMRLRRKMMDVKAAAEGRENIVD